MSESAVRLVQLLADGELHSGARLADALGDDACRHLEAGGRTARARHRSRKSRAARVSAGVSRRTARRVALACGRCGGWHVPLPADTEVFFELGSTNDYLHAAAPPPPGAPRLVFAELQTAGRGRRGREWLAPFGSGLTFSIGWTFAEMPPDLSALSLALGVCVVRALRESGAPRMQLKWPNDIVHDHAKLGGLLLQLRSEAGGPAYVVAGLGLNLHLPAATRDALRGPLATPVTDLATACNGALPARAVVAARVAARMLQGLQEFASTGFASFAAEWSAFDSLRDAPVTVLRQDGGFDGIARGVDREGALRRRTPAGRARASPCGRRQPAQGRATGGGPRMILLVDIGNTRVKWATFRGGQARRHSRRLPMQRGRSTTGSANSSAGRRSSACSP